MHHPLQISLSLPSLSQSKPPTLDFHSIVSPCRRLHLQRRSMTRKEEEEKGFTIAMSNRRKERRPLQRGRSLSIEAIQAVQALKRARSKNDSNLLRRLFDSKVRRLIKHDLIALLRELQRQNEGVLALQVFEETRKEYWYRPQVSVYADMVTVLATNGLFEKVYLLFSYLKAEDLEDDVEGFNALLKTLMEFGIYEIAMECFQLMKEVGCEPDESTFRILINGFESKGVMDFSAFLRLEAEKYFGESLEFLLEKEEEAEAVKVNPDLRDHGIM